MVRAWAGLVLLVAIAQGCGPAAPPSTSPAAASAQPTTATSAPSAPHVASGFPMHPPTPTAYASALADIGLDPAHLPPFAKVRPEQLRKVMPFFAKSLGVKCTACHDFDKPGRTPRMNIASHMWDGFVTQVSIDGGLFCDSCHHGSLQVLDRHDPQALRDWMKQSFVEGLGASGCPQCHGEPFRGRFLADWSAPPSKR